MMRILFILTATVFAAWQPANGDAGADAARHERVAARRRGVAVICHRGASEFAHENTLEAYRAALELGADGNEIDIRATRDGVLVCFHDDMLDQLLDTFGDVADYDWAELQAFPFRKPGAFGEFCRIPTLVEVFELHKRLAALMHLDVKRPDLEPAIVALLDRLDLWGHVVAVNHETAPAILKHPHYQGLRYKGSLYADRLEVDAAAITTMLEKPGEMVIVDDPRGVLVGLGRKLGRPSRELVAPMKHPVKTASPTEGSPQDLLSTLLDDADWDSIPQTAAKRTAKAESIRRRAGAAEEIRRRKLSSAAIDAALVRRVRHRSLHPEWMYNGLDAASALRALAEIRSPQFVGLARECLWRDDPAGAAVLDPAFKVPRSWTDFRTKGIVFGLLEHFPGEAAQEVCRDYLQLSDDEARRIGSPQFEPAAQALLALSQDESTAVDLLKHRRGDVRGRTILTCLAQIQSPWARAALERAAPHALHYVLPE
jgi:hypothetical protein